MNIAIIFAGGRGLRMGSALPKQFLEVNGVPIIIHTLMAFQQHTEIDAIYLVGNPDYHEHSVALVSKYGLTKVRKVVDGGDSALDSVYRGLIMALKECSPDDIVLIHDGVRPCVSKELISANIEAVEKFGNSISVVPCVETVVSVKDAEIDGIPPRSQSFIAQAPQSFRLRDIVSAHDRFRGVNPDYVGVVDQATLCHTIGIRMHITKGERANIKVTTPEDVQFFKTYLSCREYVAAQEAMGI